MGKLPSLFLVGALLALAVAQEVAVPSDGKPPSQSPIVSAPNPPNPSETSAPSQSPITVVPHTSSSESPAPIPPTTSSTTTTTTTTPPSTKPTSTTPPSTKPTSTTPPTKPTTKSTTTSTTTTTKPTPPPPTPKPPQPPANVDPPTGDWNVTYTNANGSCIFAHMAVQIEVPYHTKGNETWHAYVDVPKNATVNGSCVDNVAENMTLTWGNNSVVFDFQKKPNGTWYAVNKIKIALYQDEKTFPNTNDTSQTINLIYGDALFNTTDKLSYKCAKLQTFNLTMAKVNGTMGYLHIGHLQLQAFAVKDSKGFADAVNCESSTPDIVPIAAGCALAALIIVVLGAYLIGRRRSQARGYLSMFTETKREEEYIPMKHFSCFN